MYCVVALGDVRREIGIVLQVRVRATRRTEYPMSHQTQPPQTTNSESLKRPDRAGRNARLQAKAVGRPVLHVPPIVVCRQSHNTEYRPFETTVRPERAPLGQSSMRPTSCWLKRTYRQPPSFP